MPTVVTRPHAVTSRSLASGNRDDFEPPSSPTSENVKIVAPMKGTVNVKTTKGGFVKEGDCIAEVVSVKTELQVKAPKAGFIRRVVDDGFTLEENELIAELETDGA